MINRNLFFIWLKSSYNSVTPDWVRWIVRIYKELNPDFNTVLIDETVIFKNNVVINVDCIKNRDLKSCIIENNFHLFDGIVAKSAYCATNTVKLSDVFRFYLLEKYGGIYLDCDTFPVRPFDDNLLQYDEIISQTYSYINDPNGPHYDIWLIGKSLKKANNEKFYQTSIEKFSPYDEYYENWTVIQEKIKSKTLTAADFLNYPIKNEYVYHVNLHNWTLKT